MNLKRTIVILNLLATIFCLVSFPIHIIMCVIEGTTQTMILDIIALSVVIGVTYLNKEILKSYRNEYLRFLLMVEGIKIKLRK